MPIYCSRLIDPCRGSEGAARLAETLKLPGASPTFIALLEGAPREIILGRGTTLAIKRRGVEVRLVFFIDVHQRPRACPGRLPKASDADLRTDWLRSIARSRTEPAARV